MNKLLALALVVAASTPAVVSARTSESGDVTKSARRGDMASQYVLRADGSLFRQVGRHMCQVTTKVDEIKVPQHPDDPTALYVVRDNGGLFALPMSPEAPADACPSAELTPLVTSLNRADSKWNYRLVDRKDSPINLVAQDAEGRVTAWDSRGVAVAVDGPSSMKLNTCFGSGKSFSSYVAFVMDRKGRVVKIGGKDPRKTKVDNKRYATMGHFIATNRVCK